MNIDKAMPLAVIPPQPVCSGPDCGQPVEVDNRIDQWVHSATGLISCSANRVCLEVAS